MSAQRPRTPRERARQVWWISIPLGLALGLGVGVGHWQVQLDREYADRAERARILGLEADAAAQDVAAPPPPGEEVRALLAQDGPVIVDPTVADQVSRESVAEATAILEQSGKPLHLAFVRKPEYLYDGYTTQGLLAQWAHHVAEDGHYVVLWTGGSAEVLSVGLDQERMWQGAEGQPDRALVRVAGLMTDFTTEPPGQKEDPVLTRDDRDYWGGAGGGLGIAFLLIGFVLAPVYFVIRALMKRRPPRPENG